MVTVIILIAAAYLLFHLGHGIWRLPWGRDPPIGLSGSSRNEPASGTMTSWPTGNERGGASRCSPSRRCHRINNMDENYLPVVVGAAVVGDRMLRLLFSDGTVGDVDFSSERWTGVLEPLNDPAYFAQAAVDPEAGTVVWPGGIDLAPEPLYEQAKAHPLAAA
jgi:Protein of unknown function (DUF2442)